MKFNRKTLEIRRMLRMYYEHTNYPAGCSIEPYDPYKAVRIPKEHMGMMHLVRSEFMRRQVNKRIMSEESFRIYDNCLVRGKFRSLFDMRDRINEILGWILQSTSPVVAEALASGNIIKTEFLAHPRDVEAYKIISTGEILWNDRQNHLFVMDEQCVFDALTGTRYAKSQLTVHKMKGTQDHE